MKRIGPVHTTLDGLRWTNRLDGRVISRHRNRKEALTAGFEIARVLGVEHIRHLEEPAPTEPPDHDSPPG